MAWNTGLTGPHLNIASYQGTPLRVMAGPGTGKTFAIMRRVSRLLETGTQPSSILVVSFTRTAANDLITQLKALGSPGADLVRACTLHSLSFTLLKRNAVFQATNRVPRPLMGFEIDCLVSDLASNYGGIKATEDLISAFETSWATLQHQQPGWPQEPTQQAFQRDLINWLTFHRAMLIGELVPRALDYILRNPASPDIPNYLYILVDEYQDLNRADQALIDALAQNKNLTIVGDEDQSIYTGLRYAQPDGIIQFHQTHQNTHDEPLHDCKRCPSLPINMANALILHNHAQRPSTLRPAAGCAVGDVYIVQHSSIQEEVTYTAAFLNWYLANNADIEPKDLLVLATRRRIGYAIRDELIRLGHTTQSFFSEECLKKPSAISGYCLLNLLVYPDDQAALRAWLGIGNDKKRSAAYKRIWQLAIAQSITSKQVLEKIVAGLIPAPAYTNDLVSKFQDLSIATTALTGLTGTALIDVLWPSTDIDCADIRAMALTIASSNPLPSDILEELVAAISQPELPDGSDNIIRIMSLHKSKGLTAKCVVVVGCVAGALPTVKSGLTAAASQKLIEEQRRLFYVAITRTRQTLVLSGACSSSFSDARHMGLSISRVQGSEVVLQSSQFMSELGPNTPRVLTGDQWRTQVGF
jgi:DNA helicase II / ATP-dependent DNA helicase PcrA